MEQIKNHEYKQMVDELNALCKKLKEDLASKELNEYEQEVRIRDLRVQLKELSDAEEKLKLANRNARVLEEENNALLQKIKATESGGNYSLITGSEAVKLIDENNKLLNEVQELHTLISKANQREKQLEQKYKNGIEHQEKLESQVATLKKRNVELEDRIHEEQHQFLIAKEMWECEQARYMKDYEELLTSVQRFEEASQQRESRDVKDRGGEHQLQLTLLKEDIAELEEKLHLSEERCRIKERELWKLESVMRCELNSTKERKDPSGSDVYRVFQDQLDSFKQEVTALRGERRHSRAIPDFSSESLVTEVGDEQIEKLQSGLVFKENHIDSLEKRNHNISERCAELLRENEQLREENERLLDKDYHIEEQLKEKDLTLQELEFLLSPSQKEMFTEKMIKLQKEIKDDKLFEDDIIQNSGENESLHNQIQRYKDEIDEIKAAKDEQDTVHEARHREQQVQIEELLHQIEILRQRVSSRKSSIADFTQECNEIKAKQREQNGFFKNQNDSLTIDLLSKDKMDSVEDVMRFLESEWTTEDEMKRQIKKYSRLCADYASMLGNCEQRNVAKDEELRKYARYLDEMDIQRQKDLQRFQNEKDLLSDRNDALQKDNYAKDVQIRDLKDRLAKLERFMEEYHDAQNANIKENVQNEMEVNSMKSRIRTLEEAVAQNESGNKGFSKSKDRQLYEINEQLSSLRDANDGIRRQLVTLQEEQQESHGRLSSGRASKTPRGSARRRSTENFMYSQPSTHVSEERIRTAVADGAHLAVTVVELSDVHRNGRPITEPGYIIIKVKSVKEKYKTSVKELASVIRFDETFVFYLAQPDQDVITLHIFYKPKGGSREYHIGDACFSMATLYRGVPRQRIAPVAQSPGSKDARRAAQVEVIMQSDDFGRMIIPSEAEIEDEKMRFNELVRKLEISAPERLHYADVHLVAGLDQ